MLVKNSILLQVVLVGQSCPTLCDPMDCSPPGSSSRGISQARILGWVAIPGDRPDPGKELCLLHWQANSLPLSLREALYYKQHNENLKSLSVTNYTFTQVQTMQQKFQICGILKNILRES